jgi:hypothetical protein
MVWDTGGRLKAKRSGSSRFSNPKVEGAISKARLLNKCARLTATASYISAEALRLEPLGP